LYTDFSEAPDMLKLLFVIVLMAGGVIVAFAEPPSASF
jgi:hypothetical protein